MDASGIEGPKNATNLVEPKGHQERLLEEVISNLCSEGLLQLSQAFRPEETS
jgi:hypothetical protein